jgi:preprotein translocase subunit YajC
MTRKQFNKLQIGDSVRTPAGQIRTVLAVYDRDEQRIAVYLKDEPLSINPHGAPEQWPDRYVLLAPSGR